MVKLMHKNQSFDFRYEFYEAAKGLQLIKRDDFLFAIFDYVFTGEEPNEENEAYSMFILAKPLIDKGLNK